MNETMKTGGASMPHSYVPSVLLASVPFFIILLAGCVSSSRSANQAADAAAGAPAHANDPSTRPPVVQGQYADPSIASFPLYEVYLVNTGATPRVFSKVALDGRTLIRPAAAMVNPSMVSVDGFHFGLPTADPDPQIVWWQFYPSAEVLPGASVVLRICFRGDVRTPHQLVLSDSAGVGDALTIPRRSSARVPRLTAVVYSADLTRIYVQCDSPGNPPAALWICGRRVADLSVMGGSAPNRLFLTEASAPVRLKGGMPIDLRVRFADGHERRTLLRVLAGVSVYDSPVSEASGERLAPAVAGAQLIAIDGVCSDLSAKRPGNDAWRVIRERERLLSSCPETLSGFGFCTGVTPQTAAIYARISDAIFAKPYRHGWGSDPNRFLDEEADVIANQRAACAPFPFLYIPERFVKHGRGLTSVEVETLEWTALASGAKGLRRHFAFNTEPLVPEMDKVLCATAAQVTRLQPILAPLVPVSDETQGAEASGYVRILTAWSGSQGALFFVRDRSVGAFPMDPPSRRNVPIEIDVPSWCRGTQVIDLLTGKPLADARSGRCRLIVPDLHAFRVLWVDADHVQAALRNIPKE
jgi:hypothetical protein